LRTHHVQGCGASSPAQSAEPVKRGEAGSRAASGVGSDATLGASKQSARAHSGIAALPDATVNGSSMLEAMCDKGMDCE
jgi:hypothetical protein